MSLYREDAGTWKKASKQYSKQSGAWKNVNKGYIRDAGIWKPYFTDRLYNHPNLIHEYTFDDVSGSTIYDTTPNGSPSDAHMTTGYITNGKLGNCMWNTNGNDCFAYPPFSYNMSQGFTMTGWTYLHSTGHNYVQRMIWSGDDFVFRNNSGNEHLYIRDINNNLHGIQFGGMPTGVWTMYTSVWSHADLDIKLYRNTDLLTTHSVGIAAVNLGSFYMGHTGSEGFSGGIDQVRLFSKALSGAEITELYNNGNGY